MGRYCQLVIGPAGAGKSTYCNTIANHLRTVKRSAFVVNLDPAAEKIFYEPAVDIRDLITLDDVMEELDYGPNGGLVYCMEYLLDNLDWLEEQIGTEWEDEYMILDLPGQIELYTHFTLMKRLTDFLRTRLNFSICAVYLIESQFISDVTKFFSGVLTAMSAMVQLELPHVNVMSKMDLIEGRPGEILQQKSRLPMLQQEASAFADNYSNENNESKTFVAHDNDPDAPQSGYANTWTEEEEEERTRRHQRLMLDRFLDPDPSLLLDQANKVVGRESWHPLNEAIVRLVEEFNMVSLLPFNIHDEDSINMILMNVDHAMQFGEDEEPKDRRDLEEEPELGTWADAFD